MLCEKCDQTAVDVECHDDGFSLAMLRTGHLVCGPCHDLAYGAGDKHESVKLFDAPKTMRGQMTLE